VFTDLVMGRAPGPYRSSCLWIAIAFNWIGLMVALTKGWYVGVPVMLVGMAISGIVSRLSARPAPEATFPTDVVDRVQARLATTEAREPVLR
jgi:hypothetical protein